MACKYSFIEYVQIRNIKKHPEVKGLVFFTLIVGPFTVESCAYQTLTGSVKFPQRIGKQRFVQCKGSFIYDLRSLIIAETEKFLAKERGLVSFEFSPEYKFPKLARKKKEEKEEY